MPTSAHRDNYKPEAVPHIAVILVIIRARRDVNVLLILVECSTQVIRLYTYLSNDLRAIPNITTLAVILIKILRYGRSFVIAFNAKTKSTWKPSLSPHYSDSRLVHIDMFVMRRITR